MMASVHDDEAATIDGAKDVSVQSGGQSRDKGRRGGRGGGGQSRDVQISKALSKLLRHDADKEGIALDKEGYAALDAVMNWKRIKSLKPTFADIQNAVTENAKQRFTLRPKPDLDPIPDDKDTEPSHWLIRANQGHSIKLDSADLLTPITLEAGNVPETVVHGTYYAFYPLIVASGGLKRMTRNHVHFSLGLPDERGVISGMRGDAEILVYIDIVKSLKDGMHWWLSDNGVVLTEGNADGYVPTKYWKRVEGRRQDIGVLWEDGKEIAELPQSVRGRKAPSGKRPKGKREGEKPKGKDHRRDGGKGKVMQQLEHADAEEVLAVGAQVE
jgi:2'-phosphotransferase